MLDLAATSPAPPDSSVETVDTNSISEVGEDAPGMASFSHYILLLLFTLCLKEADACLQQPADQHASPSLSANLSPHVPRVASSGSGGLLGFLHAYNNPLTRFTTAGTTATTAKVIASAPTTTVLNNSTTAAAASSDSPATPPRKLPGGLGDIDAAVAPNTPGASRRLYPISSVLVVALIAFLIGSLLRSLLSPADFIYVVTDLREAEEANSVGGWREIRRLLEVKYVVGGWDFQVAVVRRH